MSQKPISRNPLSWLLTTSVVLAAAQACGGDAPGSDPVSTVITASDSTGIKAAKTAWQQQCVTCHGADGAGDGPAAAGFPTRPRSFKDAAWQRSVDDAYIKKIVVEGGPAVGKDQMMTGAPQLKGNDEALDYVVRIVRSFAR